MESDTINEVEKLKMDRSEKFAYGFYAFSIMIGGTLLLKNKAPWYWWLILFLLIAPFAASIGYALRYYTIK
jgi:hypothetical protein